MATQAQPQPQPIDPMQINLAATPVQVQEEIRLLVQIGTPSGVSFNVCFTQQAARAFMYLLREGIEKAEHTLVKPIPKIVSA